LPYFFWANSTLSLASIAKTVDFGLKANNFAVFPTPVPASKIIFFVFKKFLKFFRVFQPNLSRNHFC